MLCVTNLMLHGIEVPSQIRHDNTLARPLRDYSAVDRVDVILTNPPFGGVEEPGIEQGFPADVRTKETADLFLVLIKHILKPGGRAALVLPDGTLFGEGVKTRIKEQLLNECKLHTIVRLPNGVFAPYTGIKTNLLFFTKGQPTTDVWYYEHPYPAGVKTTTKPSPSASKNLMPKKLGGAARPMALPPAWKPSAPGRSAWRKSSAPTTTSTKRTPTWAKCKTTTPKTCWPTTSACRARLRRCAMNCGAYWRSRLTQTVHPVKVVLNTTSRDRT